MWVSPVEAGSTHASPPSVHELSALCKSRLPGTEDPVGKCYTDVGIGVLTPLESTSLDDTTYNHLHISLRSPVERTKVTLKHFKALQRVTLG